MNEAAPRAFKYQFIGEYDFRDSAGCLPPRRHQGTALQRVRCVYKGGSEALPLLRYNSFFSW